jgi:uncharacterized membrane protein
MNRKLALHLCLNLALILLVCNTVFAATIHGSIYDLYLQKQGNVVVTIDSTPRQTEVAKDGDYSFSLPAGEYSIEAKEMDGNETKSYASQNISVKEEGDYIIDLILFPRFEENDIIQEAESINVDESQIGLQPNWPMIIIELIGILLLIAFFVIILYKLSRHKKEIEEKVQHASVDEESKKIIAFVKDQGGRTTQKEIRKHFPSSEAKISLVITELEHKGVLEKIKKGRGNVIVLK